MAFFQDPPRYRTLLLTMWEERSQDPNLPGVWRFRLEDPRPGQPRGFASMEALVEALKEEMGDSDEAQSKPND
jgi:hypothetical protein